MSPSVRRIVIVAGSVVGLTAFILLVAALSAPNRDGVVHQDPSAEVRSDLALGEARIALRSGETTEAVSLLREAVRLDPDNTEAVEALSEAVARQPSSERGDDTSPSATTTAVLTPDDPAMLTDLEDLSALLPAEVGGFRLGTASGMGDDLTVAGTADRSGAAVPHAQWTVHDRGTPEKAHEFVNGTSRQVYPEDAAWVVIDGARAYFGTDGTRFASVSYVRGRYVFEMVLTVSGGAPEARRADAERAARAFPERL